MKKIILLVVTMVMTLSVVELSAAPKKVTKKIETTQFITNINCEKCTAKIMNYLPTQKGVKDVKVDLSAKTVTVSYDSSKTEVKTLIERFGKIDVEAKVVERGSCCTSSSQSSACAATK
ncbi:MAG: heavy-metal-associated domain-containing protein [Rikenellaceae bacterium]